MDEPRTAARRLPGRPSGRRSFAGNADGIGTAAERWLPAPDYEGLYEVSDLGRVRSLPRNGTLGGVLTPQRKQHFTVNLWCGNKMRTITVHSLVARAFLGPCPPGHQVCHGPGGGFENAVTNLSYGTPAKNLGPDKRRDGTLQAGIRNGKSKLNDETVRECRARVAAGESRGALARELGVWRSTISAIVSGETWRHVALRDPAGRTPE